MRKTVFFIFFIIIICWSIIPSDITYADTSAKIAFVIDDFGQDRNGVEEMLKLYIPLTCAIIPFMQYSASDLQQVLSSGKEAILHMPMEADVHLPQSWYGPKMIKNTDTTSIIKQTMQECIDSLKGIKGVNIHIGSGVSQNLQQMTAVMEVVKENGLYFLDSRTSDKSVCNTVANSVDIKYQYRDVFLEKTQHPDYNYISNEIKKAVEIAKKNGKAVVIGHVGPEGGAVTVNAIRDNIEYILSQGVEIVLLSELID